MARHRATQFISSPYDLQAHPALKRASAWIGYKVRDPECFQCSIPRTFSLLEGFDMSGDTIYYGNGPDIYSDNVAST